MSDITIHQLEPSLTICLEQRTAQHGHTDAKGLNLMWKEFRNIKPCRSGRLGRVRETQQVKVDALLLVRLG
jgi:hypothetical protein